MDRIEFTDSPPPWLRDRAKFYARYGEDEYIDLEQNKFKKYCPGLWNSSSAVPLFFKASPGSATSAELEDAYGELYSTLEHVYILVCPRDFKLAPNLNKFTWYSSEELVSSFLIHQSFINPKNNATFPEYQINSLSLIADPTLADVIRSVRLLNSGNIQTMQKLAFAGNQFKDCCLVLLEVAMYMRGWDGLREYPLKSINTVGDIESQTLSEKLLFLKKRLESGWLELQKMILVRYRFGEFNFLAESLWDRLKIVLEGKKMEACIRTTSNIFASTVWFYLNNFYSETPFELTQLENIS